MNSDFFYQEFKRKLFENYPSTEALPDLDLLHMVSPYVIEVENGTIERIRSFIESAYSLSRTAEYQAKIQKDDTEVFSHPSRNQSVLMAYDFHTPLQRESLIEINTNAAMFLISDLLNQIQGIHLKSKNDFSPIQALKESFLEEFRAFSRNPTCSPKKIVITDENLKQQKRYVEFLMYRDLFASWGWNPEIVEFQDLRPDPTSRSLLTPAGERIDLLYNRYCDFYLSRPESLHLRRAYLEGWCCVSPNPFEYLLLADKNRMAELSSPSFQNQLSNAISPASWKALKSSILPTFDIQSFQDRETLWINRKKFIFKPKNQYGGKSVYRGDGLTHSVFERAVNENFLVQEYVPAPEPRLTKPSLAPKGWKYDLRFYVYRDEIQNIVARLYKGQVTNFHEPLGGFASINII
ncbi:MAG: hypothetical protein IPK68_06920 [Bdellovibrionales bacterium]|nr:hypothetical protein [Bdellovibrionales bacterium]